MPPFGDPKPLTALNRSLAATAVLAALIVGAAFWLAARNKSDDAWVVHTLAVRDQLTHVLNMVQAAETGQRGYLLTGREDYLATHTQAVEQLPAALDRMTELVREDAQERAAPDQLRSVIKSKIDELQATITERKAGRLDAALAIVTNDSGLRLMQEIRDRIALMQAEEDRLLADRQSAAARSAITLQAGVAFLFLIICVIGILIARYTRTSVSKIAEARDQLRASNEALVEEIGRREQVESQLRQSQKMQAIGQLTGGIAHDFNNMLGVIMGAHDLIARRIQKGDFNIGRFIKSATEATERAAILTQRLLAFARQQPLAPQPINVNTMIGNMSALLHSTLGEQIRIETVAAAGIWT
jgi:CHASE3 domain sensor protein